MYPQYPPTQYPTWPPVPHNQPLFRVRLVKHTGLMMMWYQQTYTVTGTYAQCEAAIRAAQQYNLAAGWWSPLSALLLNWIALATNESARKELQRNAAQAQAAQHPAHTAAQYGAPPPTHPPAGWRS
jgi:hypothetical protein